MVWRGVAAAAAVLCMQQAQAFQVTLKNQCSGDMVLFDSSSTETIAEGSSTTRTIAADSGAHVYRYGTGAQATLAEFSGDAGYAWYDISIIPTSSTQGPDYCESLAACKAYTGGVGFNVAMQITPDATDGSRCVELNCPADGCDDAYQYPKDDTKTHTCAIDTDFTVTFCYTNSVATPEPTTATPEPTTATPEPTPEPTTATPEPTTATPEPTTEVPSGSIANEADGSWSLDSLVGSGSSTGSFETGSASAGSFTAGSTSNSTDSGDDEVASDYDVETAAPSTTTSDDATETGGVSIGGSPSTSSDSGSAQEANTQSAGSEGAGTGYIVLGAGAAASVAAVAAVYTIRKKKAQLDEMENKTPTLETATHARDARTIVMTTPQGSMLL